MSTQALSPDTPRTSRLPGHLMLALAVLPFLFVALWEMRAPLDLSIGDQAQYLLHARSIETGRGYTDDGYIYSPRAVISPQAYPPGLPLVIAGVDTLGGSLVVTRLLMIACAALFLYLAGRYLATRDDPLLGAASVVMCAFIPNFALYATGLYSDYAFAAAAWGCCLLADRPGEWSRGRIAGLTVLGVIAIVFRTIGIALVPALVIHQAWRTWRHREPWTRAIVPLVAWVATYVAIDQLLPVAQGYAQQITSGGADVADRKSAFWLLKHFLLRALSYRDVVSGMLLIPTRWRLVNSAYHAVALVAVVVGAIAWVRRAGVRFLFCFVVVYVGLFVLIPWRIGRYMWPLAPVVWFTALNGVRVALQAMRVDRVRAAWIPALAAAAIGVAAVLIGPEAPPLVGIGDLPEGRALYAALEREAATMPVRAMAANPRDAARLPGVSAMAILPLKPDSLLAAADSNRITHAILGSMNVDTGADHAMRAILERYPARFKPVYQNAQFTLYRIVPAVSLR